MTEAELAKMSDEDKVRMIAEKVMGWRAASAPGQPADNRSRRYWNRGGFYIHMPAWNPLTDGNARDDLVDAMVDRGWSICTLTDKARSLVTIQREGEVCEWECAPDRGTALVNACLLAIGDEK